MRKLALILLPILLVASCSRSYFPAATGTPTYPSATFTVSTDIQPTYILYRPGSWTYRTPYRWVHDGLPYESEHFIIYTDSAREDEKKQFAEEAEKSLTFILDFLHIADEELRYPPVQKKIEVFGSTKHLDELGGGYAYYGGFLFTYNERDYRVSQAFSPYSFLFEPLFTHEITHDVGFLLMGYSSHNSLLVTTWFDEGLATYVAEDDWYRISSLSQLNGLRQSLEDVPGQGNPMLISRWDDIPYQYFSDEMMNKLYALFELAVRYLVDTYGVEKCKWIYLDARAGMSFKEAFEDQYGMSVTKYQDTFFSMMEGYLP
jgi:hypothetical protein